MSYFLINLKTKIKEFLFQWKIQRQIDKTTRYINKCERMIIKGKYGI